MGKILRFIRHYPWVVAATIVGLAGLIAHATLSENIARWLITGFAAIVAIEQSTHMVRSLLRKQWGLDVLAITAIVSTLLVGEYWASLIIVLMLTGGEALEDAAALRATRELTALLDKVPHTAHRMTLHGHIEDIPASAVEPGDRLVVRPSELVPVDGDLLTPVAELDESSLTGESLPVSRQAGEGLLSGSVNGLVALEMVATRRAEDSEYQQIVGLVQQAASSKAPLVRLADRYAIPFTALAYTIAGIAWAMSGDPVRFAEVLVVATPCPLLIAAPVAFMGGMSRAAKSGIVIKDAGTLERLSQVRTVGFDKTGTLTHGTPEVGDIQTADTSRSGDELLQLVASAEQYSSHVLAAAIVKEAHNRGLTLVEAKRAEEIATDGVTAEIGNHVVHVGKPSFVAKVSSGLSKHPVHPGETVVYVAIDEKFAGYIVLRDSLRDEAPSTLRHLRNLGINRTVMLSGDQQATAESIADELGITEVHGECLPADKVRIVGELLPRRVMMVGDGVNDAPVLAASDVGIALGARGSTAASESADVVILIDDLSRAARAVEIGQSTIRIALQSIWLGIIISAGLMVVAAAGFLPAILGALLQEVVDLVAIVGALRAVRDTPSRGKRGAVDSNNVERARV